MNAKTLTAAALSVAAFTTAACGSDAGSKSSGATGPVKPTPAISMSNGSLALPGKGPVDTTILIDRTPLAAGDKSLAQAYETSALQLLEPTITRGGIGKIEVFGRVAGHALNVITNKVPSLKEAGPAARDDEAQKQAFASALDIAVGLAQPAEQADQKALAKVTQGPGTDIARAAADAAVELTSSTADATVVGIETDGWIDQTDFNLKQTLNNSDVKVAGDKIAAASKLKTGIKPVSFMRIGALGLTADRSDPDSPELGKLNDSWERGCKHLAKTCETDTQP